jgi:hypothetical protein
MKVGQLLEPADVLTGQNGQAIELGRAEHDDILGDILGDEGSGTAFAPAGRPQRDRAGRTVLFHGPALAGMLRRALGSVHVTPPQINSILTACTRC